MALTLVEAAKLHSGEVLRSSIMEIYAQASDILRVLPFTDIPGNAYKYNQEQTLPGVGFRGLNEAYSEATGVINPQVEALVIAGGDLDVDTFIVKTQGADQRSVQEAMKAKNLAHTFSHKFIKGDSSALSKEFDGLQVRLTGAQKIANGGTPNGNALSLAKLDELIDSVEDPNYLLMSRAMRRRLTAASRSTTVGGHINFSQDQFGRRVTQYNDLPILIADGLADVNATLAFNEANPGGGTSTGTSIYCLSVGEGRLSGIQNGAMDARDLGELETKPVLRTRIEWFVSPLVEHPRCAGRLWGISDAAVEV